MSMLKFAAIILFFCSVNAMAEDTREMVKMPEKMQEHMLSNMRDHLRVIDEILMYLAQDNPDKAAEVAENRLGMSSLGLHGASHMAKFMPEPMQAFGTGMHRAASRFALKAQEGDLIASYKALREVTASCNACHSAYRIR